MQISRYLFGFALALAVSATPSKRDLTSLQASLASISSQTDALNTAIDNFNQSMTITKALANVPTILHCEAKTNIDHSYQTMDTTIKTLSGSITQANSDASGSDTFGIVDSVTILCNVYSIIPKLEAALQNLIDQQSGFTLLHLLLAPIALLIEADLLAVKTAAAALENSMLNKTQGVQVPMQSAFDELSATIDNAISTYSLLGLLK